MGRTIIELQDIYKRFYIGTPNELEVLHGISIHVTEGEFVSIVGASGSGKSTLMNMLSGKEKSIVTHIEGTTRDIVENSVRLGSLVLHLSDTAGLRESDDVVEAIGIKKALERIDTASLVLAVFDSSRELDDDDKMLIDSCKGKKAVAVINKTDLSPKINTDKIKDNFEKILSKKEKIYCKFNIFIVYSLLSWSMIILYADMERSGPMVN